MHALCIFQQLCHLFTCDVIVALQGVQGGTGVPGPTGSRGQDGRDGRPGNMKNRIVCLVPLKVLVTF